MNTLRLISPLALLCLVGIACQSESNVSKTLDIPADSLSLTRFRCGSAEVPYLVLIFEAHRTALDDAALRTLEAAARQPFATMNYVALDLTESKNRAAAAPFHPGDSPLLVGLSPDGIVVFRDVVDSTDLIDLRAKALPARAESLDLQFRNIAKPDPNSLAVAEFLIHCGNQKQAIPLLRSLTGDESHLDVQTRIRAWVELCKAHLWVGEPEKARHAAQQLLATLGPTHADAQSGGQLVMGLQDVPAKRFDLAKQELNAAIAASPDSDYATQARDALKNLPTTQP